MRRGLVWPSVLVVPVSILSLLGAVCVLCLQTTASSVSRKLSYSDQLDQFNSHNNNILDNASIPRRSDDSSSSVRSEYPRYNQYNLEIPANRRRSRRLTFKGGHRRPSYRINNRFNQRNRNNPHPPSRSGVYRPHLSIRNERHKPHTRHTRSRYHNTVQHGWRPPQPRADNVGRLVYNGSRHNIVSSHSEIYYDNHPRRSYNPHHINGDSTPPHPPPHYSGRGNHGRAYSQQHRHNPYHTQKIPPSHAKLDQSRLTVLYQHPPVREASVDPVRPYQSRSDVTIPFNSSYHGHSTNNNNNRRESPAQNVDTSENTRIKDIPDDNDSYSTLRGAEDLKVGKALNIFSRYGFLTLSVKVRPPVGEDNFLFLENTAEVFQKNSYWGKREVRRHRGNYDDHFYIHFCEDLSELLIAYFDHFTIEGVPKAHKAFTSSSSVRDLARQFGINSSSLNGHFSFVLVRLFRRRKRSTLKGPLEMDASLKQALQEVRVGSTESVHQFVDRYGSHVISEFEVGDMMYQTFVFGERLYKELKNKFAIGSSENHLEELQQYFVPSYAANVGNLLLASGNEGLSRILKDQASSPHMLLYPNILKVFENPLMEAEFEKLNGEVVLSLKLDKITTRLPRSPETRWMSEVLDNTLAIYYQQMSSTRKNS